MIVSFASNCSGSKEVRSVGDCDLMYIQPPFNLCSTCPLSKGLLLMSFESDIAWRFTHDWSYVFAFVHFNGMLVFVQGLIYPL
jgi:hypothetical protein